MHVHRTINNQAGATIFRRVGGSRVVLVSDYAALAVIEQQVGRLTMLRLTLILSLAAPALFVLGNVLFLFLPPGFLANAAIFGFFGSLGLAIVAWLMGAFVTARQRRWGWFALALCLPYAGSLIYSVLETIAPRRASHLQDA